MRLVTRSDFDGLACAVLFKELGMLDDIKFAHPKDVQDGLVEVTEDDILANVPYVKGCGLWFDHHSSEEERGSAVQDFKGALRSAPSAARVVWEYYGGTTRFGRHLDSMMSAVDKADSGSFTAQEILEPRGWDLLSFIMDARTGLGRYRDYRVGNYQLMMDLIDYCRTMRIDEILEVPDVKERVTRYFEQETDFVAMLAIHSRVDGNVIITDLRGKDEILSGNRFIIYALHPEQNINVWVIDGRNKQNCVFTVGHSIVNRTARTNVGSLMLKYGGGGHDRAGTCQVPNEDADRVLAELISKMKAHG